MSQKKHVERDYHEIKVDITGFSEESRRDMLNNKKHEKKKLGWQFISYHDDGMKSYAIFMAPKKRLPWKIIGVIIALLILMAVASLIIP